jgi:hypothetical protein
MASSRRGKKPSRRAAAAPAKNKRASSKPEAPVQVLPSLARLDRPLKLSAPEARRPLRPIQVRPSKARLMMPSEED